MKLFDQVLAYCNRIREEEGLKPLKKLPRGYMRSNSRCPIATALLPLNAAVYTYKISHDDRQVRGGWRRHIPLPKYVSTFITRFDKGDFPELVKRP